MRDKRYQSTEKGLDDLADLMLGRINSCVDDRAKKNVKIKSATVTKVNEDGTVNVSLPDDEGNGFSRIQNQSVYELDVGDSVEIMLKEGSFSNCWVIAKHGGGSKRVNLVNSGTISVTNTGGSSGGSGGSDGGSKKCTGCYGTGKCTATNCLRGKCARCAGTGIGTMGRKCNYCNNGYCRTCSGTGKCKYCNGTGKY